LSTSSSRVVVARLLQRLDQLARERADVRAPMPADLGLVADAAEREAHEFAARRARDRLREARLADAGGAHEAEHRALELLRERLHGEVLEDALFDLLEAIVILFEDVLGLFEIVALFALVVPGELEDPVDVVADDGRLCARRVHHLELLELFLDLGGGLFAHPLGLERLFDLLNLVLELVALAATQLLLDGLHLLV